jgi:hypothetical protein
VSAGNYDNSGYDDDWTEIMKRRENGDWDLLMWAQNTLPAGDPAQFLNAFFPVWKSTSASGAHVIELALRRWRGGRRDDSARTRRKILISTQVLPHGRGQQLRWLGL